MCDDESDPDRGGDGDVRVSSLTDRSTSLFNDSAANFKISAIAVPSLAIAAVIAVGVLGAVSTLHNCWLK